MSNVWRNGIVVLLILCMVGLSACKAKEPDEEAPDSETVAEELKNQEEDNPDRVQEPEEEVMTPEMEAEANARNLLENMTLEEKVAQMFVIIPDSLTGVENTTAAGDVTRQKFSQYPVGGFILMRGNIVSEQQVVELNSGLKQISQERIGTVPFLCVDEEGGTVTRIASSDAFPVADVGTMASVGATGDPANAYQAGAVIGSYLSAYQFNVDFAPDADVLLNPENTVIGSRSFGGDADLVASMVEQEVQGLHSYSVCATLKHFPGHGATAEDSHEGYAYSLRSLEEIQQCELKPFVSGIQADAEFVMMGHISYPNITGDDTPATLSAFMVQEVLRNQLGFEGIIITDAMNMGAISDHYTSGESAVLAVQAGVDMILEPTDFYAAYQALLDSVNSQVITEERIDESVLRILKVKQGLQ